MSYKKHIFYFRKKLYKFKLLIHKYILNTQHPIKSIYGIYLTPNFKDTTFKYYFKGTYGTFLLDLLHKQKERAIFIDIGANQGLFSILAAKNSAIEKVIAFEPSLTTGTLLKANLKINGISNCQIEALAISSSEGPMLLNSIAGHSGKSSLQQHNNGVGLKQEKVSTISDQALNSIIPKHDNYIIKIDVEGHEAKVIDALTKCDFLKRTRWIFCEINENWVDFNGIKHRLKQHGFNHCKKIGAHSTEYDVLFQRTI